MKRTVTVILCLVTISVGLWVISASETLGSACTLSSRTGGGNSCVSGLPFYLLGGGLIAVGSANLFVMLVASIRAIRRTSAQPEQSEISTLHHREVDSLRDVA
jgi:hypothetical protein